jgi:hypothetical protein
MEIGDRTSLKDETLAHIFDMGIIKLIPLIIV